MTVEDIDNENQDIEDTDRVKDILRKHRDISKWDEMLGDGWEARARKFDIKNNIPHKLTDISL